MTIKFERRTTQPDVTGRCLVERLTVAGYSASPHDAWLGHLRDLRGAAQNTVAGMVEYLKPSLKQRRD